MRLKPFSLRCAVAAAACAGSGAAFAAPDARGVWLNDTGRGAIEIKDCSDKLCGHVVWTRDQTDASRGCGKQMIGDVATSGNGVWDGGWVYSPDKKKRFDVEIKPLADGTLRVMGYAGTKFFSKTMIWTKAPADLQRCDASKVQANVTPSSPPPANAPVGEFPVKPEPQAAPAPSTDTPATEAAKPPEPAQAASARKAPSKPAETKQAETPPEAAPEKKAKPERRVAEAEDLGANDIESAEDLIDKLDGKEFGDGYGLKRLPDGDCRIKVPYVTLTVPCKK